LENKLKFIAACDLDKVAREVPTERILELTLTAPELKDASERPPINMALVIDRSGSMMGEKLEYAKRAAHFVVDMMQEDDTLSLVAYDQRVKVLSESVSMNDDMKRHLHNRIEAIRSGNTTNLSGGWLEGCRQIASNQREGSVNRALLLSDGLANVGICDLEELGMHARELFGRGISSSTFGVGLHFNEHLMEHIANQGGGNYYFIEHPEQIPDIFKEEFKEIAAISAHDTNITLQLPEGISAKVPGGWLTSKASQQLKINVSHIPANMTRKLYLCLTFPPEAKLKKAVLPLQVNYKNETGDALVVKSELTFDYAPQKEVQGLKMDADIRSGHANVVMSDESLEAMKLERQGKREAAHARINMHLGLNQANLSDEDIRLYQGLSTSVHKGMTAQEAKRRSYERHRQRRMRDLKNNDP